MCKGMERENIINFSSFDLFMKNFFNLLLSVIIIIKKKEREKKSHIDIACIVGAMRARGL
jgi:hypothetical protein